MLDWEQIKTPQLDIVGIVAVLGEGSTNRNAQASALGWHHILPRLLPAPQALLRHERAKRLPTVAGTVVGAYSGNVKFELNFFCQLLHDDNLGKHQVELVEVTHNTEPSTHVSIRNWFRRGGQKQQNEGEVEDDEKDKVPFFKAGEQAYGVKPFGPLVSLSILGFFMSLGMIAGSIKFEDGFALLATVLLSSTSFLVGLASWWRLDFTEEMRKLKPQKDRQDAIPDSDVVIYYPRPGAFRIIRCSEDISKLYFRTENCEYVLGDNAFRAIALLASFFLMVGLLFMSNSKIPMQIGFAASYIFLNAIYWALSAIKPTGTWGHWRHKYKCKAISVVIPQVAPTPATPARFDTQDSLQNIPVWTQKTITPSGTALVPRENITIASTNSSTHQDDDTPGLATQVRQRRVGFGDRLTLSTNPILGLDIHMEPLPVSQDSPVQQTTGITTSPAQLTVPGPSFDQRKDTKDMEAQKERFRQPFGSAKVKMVDWLNNKRLISKRPPRPSSTLTQAEKSETFTSALWKAIAVTGSTRWLKQTHIAPDNEVWRAWIEMAGEKAATQTDDEGNRRAACVIDDQDQIQLPSWDYQLALTNLFEKEADLHKRRPPPMSRLYEVVREVRQKHTKVKGIGPTVEYGLRLHAKTARERAQANRSDGTDTQGAQQEPLSGTADASDNVSGRDFAVNAGSVQENGM